MLRNVLFSFAVCCLFGACSTKQEMDMRPADGAIRLGVSEVAETRSSVNNLTELAAAGDKIGVFGIPTTENRYVAGAARWGLRRSWITYVRHPSMPLRGLWPGTGLIIIPWKRRITFSSASIIRSHPRRRRCELPYGTRCRTGSRPAFHLDGRRGCHVRDACRRQQCVASR